jgi:hypothetical protein
MSIQGLVALLFLTLFNIPVSGFTMAIYPLTSVRHFGCLQILAIVDKVAIDI